MSKNPDSNAMILLSGALGLFLIGGVLTTAVPALIEKSWRTPVRHAVKYTAQQKRGRKVYGREGCWYCHTQQIRTLRADTVRYGWRGVNAPISVPGEYVNDQPHYLGTRRIGPDLARVGGKYDRSWHLTHFRNPRHLVPGSIMPPLAWLVDRKGGKDFEDLLSYIQTLGRGIKWRPDNDYEQ